MIASMTGFARRESVVAATSLVCEVRSVNHRYLEAGLRLPDELRALEGEFRSRLQKDLKRGKVDCTFSLRSAATVTRQLELDPTTVAQVSERLDELARVLKVDRTGIDLMDVLRFPGVLREAAADPEPLLAAARELFGGAVTDLAAMRAREGVRLAELISQRCEQLSALVVKVRERLPEVHAAIRGKFDERVAELTVTTNPDRFEQELALILQRLDVAEELDRLGGHLEEILKIIASPEPAGRRLDFLMQELNREANTLSSKSQDLATTRMAVDMKVLIEQMR
ncbi:MAG: YicC/YloC family endoribonuclease, partial [Steroidobacteraceae bacterium]